MALPHRCLRSLPFELIEEIIVVTALLGDTRVAATLSQTCRSFRALVYDQFHKHLWREMFLVVFDNPFLARDIRTHGRVPLPHLNPGKHKCPSVDVFPWEAEYKRRIRTESFILRRTRPSQDSSELPSSNVEVHTVLQTLLRIISTAAPLPNDALACMESHPSHTMRPHPICPPLFVTTHMCPTRVLGSRNIAWLSRILSHGLPHALMARLTVLDENGEVDIQKRPVEWDGLLAKLVAQIGLTTLIGTTHSVVRNPILPLTSPISMSNSDSNGDGIADIAGPPVEEGNGTEDGNGDDTDDPTAQSDLVSQEPHDVESSDDSDFLPEIESTGESDDEELSDLDGDEVFGSIATPATTSLDGVRRLARIRVYNMTYLRPSRAFGPFLPVDDRSSKPSRSTEFFADAEEEGGSSSTGVPPVPPIPESSPFLNQLFDPDYDFGDDDKFPTGQGGTEDEGAFLSSLSLDHGDHLRFDWAWIAAARQVVELNLRDLLMTRHRDVLRALISLEGLRPCSAPGFPLTVPEWSAAEGEGSGGEDDRQYRDGEGWDWAGVEGQWRCVIDMTSSPVSYQCRFQAVCVLVGLWRFARCVYAQVFLTNADLKFAPFSNPVRQQRVSSSSCVFLFHSALTRRRGREQQSLPPAQRFSHPALYEVMRIIPLTIRISHYTCAPAAWPGRPTIHVVGEGHTATPPALTRVRGTVEMMPASGDVRWTLVRDYFLSPGGRRLTRHQTSSREDGDGEWASEGVQLGGRGSAMGVIGMWTGADHEPSDPLGSYYTFSPSIPGTLQ
jgi:hypothetical protein